jgi:hypothetical protein
LLLARRGEAQAVEGSVEETWVERESRGLVSELLRQRHLCEDVVP